MSTSRTREKADGELFKSTGIDDNATSTAVTIDSNENVGINETSPAANLHLGASSPHIDIGPSGANRGKIGFNSNNVYIGSTSGAGEIHFKNNISSNDAPNSSGDTKMVISDSAVIIGNGVTLGNGTTYAAANTLDDYEEGTWTPSITRSGISIGSYAIRYGSYTKIGNQVTLFCKVQSSNVSGGSGAWSCTGLPFAPTGTNANTSVGRNYMDADTNDRDFRIAGNVADLMITSADNGYQANTGYVIWTFTSTFQVA